MTFFSIAGIAARISKTAAWPAAGGATPDACLTAGAVARAGDSR